MLSQRYMLYSWIGLTGSQQLSWFMHIPLQSWSMDFKNWIIMLMLCFLISPFKQELLMLCQKDLVNSCKSILHDMYKVHIGKGGTGETFLCDNSLLCRLHTVCVATYRHHFCRLASASVLSVTLFFVTLFSATISQSHMKFGMWLCYGVLHCAYRN